jgi:hypothetical protein
MRSNPVEPMERTDCSNSSVKSKFELHPWTTGPKVSSMEGEQVDGMVTLSAVYAS